MSIRCQRHKASVLYINMTGSRTHGTPILHKRAAQLGMAMDLIRVRFNKNLTHDKSDLS
jgi:hypothetical protein